MHDDHGIPIWFFVGALLTIYGVLVLISGVYQVFYPPVHKVALWNLHADVWWGGVLLVLGLIYVIRFWPTKQ